MRLITKKELIQELATEWMALGLDNHSEDFTKQTLENSFTRMLCEECGKDVDLVLRLGAEEGDECLTLDLCRTCVRAGIEMFGGNKEKDPSNEREL